MKKKLWSLKMTDRKTGRVYLYTEFYDLKRTQELREDLLKEIDAGNIENFIKSSDNYGTMNWSRSDRREAARRASVRTSKTIGRMGTDEPYNFLTTISKEDTEEMIERKRYILSQWDEIQNEYEKRMKVWENEIINQYS